jgi:tRNA wybutosine-synthesizing protein 1
LWHNSRVSIIVSVALSVIFYKIYRALSTLLYQETASIGQRELPKNLKDIALSDKTKTTLELLERRGAKLGTVKLKPTSTGPKYVSGKEKLSSFTKSRNTKPNFGVQDREEGDFELQICIFFSSLAGSTAQYAEQLKNELFTNKDGVYPKLSIPTPSNSLSEVPMSRTFLPPLIFNLEQTELDEYFVSIPKLLNNKKVKYIYLIIVPSYETDSPVAPFLDHLQETHHDFRIDTAPLQYLAGFSVFGFGDSSEWPASDGKFCRDAVEVDKWMGKLTGGKKGSRRMFPIGMGDVNPTSSQDGKGTAAENFREWRIHLEDAMREYAETGELGGDGEWRTALESEDEESGIEDGENAGNGKEMADLEDLGGMINRSPDVINRSSVLTRPAPLPVDFTTPAGRKALDAGEGQSSSRKEMVPKDGVTYTALTKQGYSIVGSHSGVKICRWTKSALRGRGSCYKFSFYGIKSHLCMETTPSLSCSNKCVFV